MYQAIIQNVAKARTFAGHVSDIVKRIQAAAGIELDCLKGDKCKDTYMLILVKVNNVT